MRSFRGDISESLGGRNLDVKKDYYAVLGLDQSATPQEIKKAYRQLVRQYHPDVAGAEATENFRQIQEAYEVLGDPQKRRAYDQWRIQEGLAHEPALILRATPSHQILPCLDEEQVLYILVEIIPAAESKARRPPLNLCLVLDRSTSMQGQRLQRVKEATNYIIDYLDENDIFSLVVFSDRAEVIIPGQKGLDKAVAKARVSTIRSSGGTEILQGLEAGLRLVERRRTSETINHLILLTDGQTYGDEEGCLQAAERARRRNISISTMGIGQDWNDWLLDEIATRSGGISAYIDSTARITSILRESIHNLGAIFARNLQLTIRLAEHIRLREAFRISPYIIRLPAERTSFELGQLGQEQALALLLETLIVPNVPPGEHRLLQLEVTGDVPLLNRKGEKVKQEVAIRFTPKRGDTKPVVPPAIVSTLGKLAIFKMQEKTMNDLERGDVERATQRLETMATRLLNLGETDLAKAALLEAGRLARTGHLSPEGRKKIRYGTRALGPFPKEVKHD